VFGGKSRYVVQVPRKGGSYVVGTIEAKNIEDAQNTLVDMLETEANNPAVRSAKYVHLIESKSGARYKVKNPYYDPELAEKEKKGKTPDPKEIEAYAYLSVIESMASNMGRIVPELFNVMINSSKEMIESMTKEMIQKQVSGSIYDNLHKLGVFISSLVELAKNRNEVIEFLKQLQKEGVGLGEVIGMVTKESGKGEDQGSGEVQ